MTQSEPQTTETPVGPVGPGEGSSEERGGKRKASWSVGITTLCLALALSSPILVFVAAFATRFGIIDWRLGFDVLTMDWGRTLSGIGFIAAGIGLIVALAATIRKRPRAGRAAVMASLALVATGLTMMQFQRYKADYIAAPKGSDVSTDLSDPPMFSGQLGAARQADGGVALGQPVACEGVVSLPSQSAPGAAAYALKKAGFSVLGFGVGRADGSHNSFWYGFGYDATIRIRPGRTDVRVSGRDARNDAGMACRLAGKIVEALQPPAA